ncbi:TraB/GumN family protein [Myxococcaceae bacterium JPH2]|nr:TraB/GumN family protein [Myxococcaceae bacterium JPH2]
MKRPFPLKLLLLSVLLGVGCATAPRAVPDTTPEPKQRAMLWEVRSPSGATAYVVGSVHVAKDGQLELPGSMESAFSRADTLVVELDTTTLDKTEMQQLVQRHGMLPRGQRLSEHIEPETNALLVPALLRVGIPRSTLEPMRPWLVSLTLTTVGLMRAGYDGNKGVDQTFLKRAHAASDSGLRGKDIIPLETAEQQVMLLAGVPEALQDLMLREQLQNDEEQTTAYFEKMMGLWNEGDATGLAAMIFPSSADPKYQPVYEEVYFKRNERMAHRLDGLLREPPRTHFVVVGAGHVVGPRGIPALLKARGYEVRQLGRD